MDKYQSLVAWQSAHAFVISVCQTTDQCYHPRARSIFDQLRRAALSIEANLVEGYALESTAQFLRHLVIARGSAAECECLIRIVRELDYIRQPEISRLAGQIDLAMRTLCGLIRSQRRRVRGKPVPTSHSPLPPPSTLETPDARRPA